MIAIIDYGMGNLRSVQKAFEHIGADTKITQDPKEVIKADKVVLPGVGAFKVAIEKLESLRLVSVLREVLNDGKPYLGLCLGLHLLFDKSSEGGKINGLGVFSGEVKRFDKLKVPHMGWNQIKLKAGNSKCPLFEGIQNNSFMYFCHSYYVAPKDSEIIAASTDYGDDFVSAICKDNIMGVQFHPEKSQEMGIKILKNFVSI